MYEIIEKYLNDIIELSSIENPLWNIEKIKLGRSNNWNYVDGCMLNAILELYKITKNKKYLSFVDEYIDYYVNEDGSIKTYNINKYALDDICESRVLFDLYTFTQKEKYLKAIEVTYEQIKKQPRIKAGNFWHKLIYPNQVWLDGLYMVMPFYTKYKNLHHDYNYQDIINQYQNVRKIMFDETKKLYYHGYDETKQMFWADNNSGLSKNFWLRAIGWYLVSLVDVYELIHNDQDQVILEKQIKELIEGLLKYQDYKSKMFYQVVDKKNATGNYHETSGSAMIAYSILKAYRLNIVDQNIKEMGIEIFNGICNNYLREKEGFLYLENICLVAGLGPSDNLRRDGSYEYYISEPVVANEGKGIAPLIMAYIELKRG